MSDIVIENIVVSTQVTDAVDLQKISAVIPGAIYNPDEIPAVILHVDTPKSVVMLFADGHAMITGIRSTEDIETIFDLLAKKLSVVEYKVLDTPVVTSHQVIASVHLNQPLDLAFLAQKLSNTSYNPKRFPGLVYKGENPNAVILLFNTGKIVCAVTTIEEVAGAVQNITEKLMSFRMDDK